MAHQPKLAVRDRSPLHPSALRIGDVHPGVRYIRFSKRFGIMGGGTFISGPYVSNWGESNPRLLVVRVRQDNGRIEEEALADLGIVRYGDRYGLGWNHVNFTVSANKRHLLPEPTGSHRTSMRYGLGFGLWDDEDYPWR